MAVAARLLSVVDVSSAPEREDLTAIRSDYVVILAALICALICAIGLAVVARCVCLHRRFNLSMMTSARPTRPLPPQGISKKTLQLLPTTKYECGLGSSDEQNECAICLTEFSDGDLMRILPLCSHVFHVTCIDRWLVSHSSCPSCRQVVVVVAQCHNCGGLSADQSLNQTDMCERDIDRVSRQDYVHRLLP